MDRAAAHKALPPHLLSLICSHTPHHHLRISSSCYKPRQATPMVWGSNSLTPILRACTSQLPCMQHNRLHIKAQRSSTSGSHPRLLRL